MTKMGTQVLVLWIPLSLSSLQEKKNSHQQLQDKFPWVLPGPPLVRPWSPTKQQVPPPESLSEGSWTSLFPATAVTAVSAVGSSPALAPFVGTASSPSLVTKASLLTEILVKEPTHFCLLHPSFSYRGQMWVPNDEPGKAQTCPLSHAALLHLSFLFLLL
jgi:hypothetical protein